MQPFQLIAVCEAPLADPSVAIAASRAGALGVLDLTHVPGQQAASDAVVRLARLGRGSRGIKLDTSLTRTFSEATVALPDEVDTAILVPDDPMALPACIEELRRRKLSVILEVTSAGEAALAEEFGLDAVIAKGHEAGGRVGEETTFILLQHLLDTCRLPVLAQGGIGLHIAAGCRAAGAAGLVVDSQLLLTQECCLPPAARELISLMDGTETACLGAELGLLFRVYSRPGRSGVEALRQTADELRRGSMTPPERLAAWKQAIRERVGWDRPEQVWPVGQDAAFASHLAGQFSTVGRVLEAYRQAADSHIRSVRASPPFAAGSPLARSHGTHYPIVQGPMTRVSDQAAFAERVAEAGALPFLALALMRRPDVEALLEETARTLADRPWGVGVLGFVPTDLRDEQLDVIRRHRPTFALIAGGRPDQAHTLEETGIATYLHVPSPTLLRLFLERGVRRFVFEGQECGGHVGPRPSFVLWEGMIEELLTSLPPSDLADCHLLFAGGIHNARSAAIAAAACVPLADRGAKVGVLLGSAYLFTHEAVASGAIDGEMQRQAIACTRTVLLETGPGHSTRCADTAFVQTFEEERQRLLADGQGADAVRDALEGLNLGRLRIAAKGMTRNGDNGREPPGPKLSRLSTEDQQLQGMFMMGQLAALKGSPLPLTELHHDVSAGSSQLLRGVEMPALARMSSRGTERPCDIAVVGMACILPKAPNLETYWQNILNKVDAITEIPSDRWDWRRYFDADPKAPDKVYSRWGGFLDDISFDPVRYGIPPTSLPFIEPLQLLTLEAVREALDDAGYLDKPFDRQHASVILGVGGGVADLGHRYALRAGLPMVMDEVPPAVFAGLPEWTEDSFAGILLNVAAGRVANRFDFGGVNYTVDAACASSLAAIHLAARELDAGTSDFVVAGGAETVQNPFGYLAFSKTQALSPTGRCRTFDEKADGIAISEGIAVVVLRRLADAEADGDRIYAVIKGVAGSSDGRALGLTAPRPEGQALALERAYRQAGLSPRSVSLIEAHGTGTVAGDQAEVQTLKQVFEAAGARGRSCAIGSVKSMIGHTKCAAGVAGLIKVAKALHHRVLPPTLNVEHPNRKADFAASPFYVNTEARPWLAGPEQVPRRAGVSAFGFGGTNFHAVLEEYAGDYLGSSMRVASAHWPSETLVLSGETLPDLLDAAEHLERALDGEVQATLADLASSLWHLVAEEKRERLTIVATSLADLRAKLGIVLDRLRTGDPAGTDDPRGIFHFPNRPLIGGRVAFLFPGQGSQYCNMLSDLAQNFVEVREAFERADATLRDRLPQGLGSRVFPPSSFAPEEEQAHEDALTTTNLAQPALGAASRGLVRLLENLALRPDMVAGHSYGEYPALCLAGVFTEDALYRLSEARGRSVLEAASEGDLGTMAAVQDGPERVRKVLNGCPDAWIANLNGLRQTVISGTRAGVAEALERLAAEGIQARQLRVACAFHSPIMAPARQRLAAELAGMEFDPPKVPVFATTTAAPYPADPVTIAGLLTEQLLRPVLFAAQVEAMYEAGARIFVEVGPKGVLTSLVGQILEGRPHLAVAVDAPGQPGITQLNLALARLIANGVPVDLERLYTGRSVRNVNLADVGRDEVAGQPKPTTWLVNGGSARPAGTPAPTPKITKGHVAAPVVSETRSPPPSPQSDRSRSAPAGAPASSRADEVMLSFQRLMDRFLETQREVMTRYLEAAEANAIAPPDLRGAEASLQPVSFPPEFSPRKGAGPLPQPEPQPESPSGPQSEPGTGVEEGLSAPPPPESIAGTLVAILAERTGYPPEMLGADLDLESELGIDSIKRVELLGTFQRTQAGAAAEMLQQSTERLLQIKNVRALAEAIAGILGGSPRHPGPLSSSTDGSGNGWHHDRAPDLPPGGSKPDALNSGAVPRALLRVVESPILDGRPALPAGGVFLITDDGGGVAGSLAAAIQRLGGRGVVVSAEGWDGPGAALASVESVRREAGPIVGVIHLLPLRADPDGQAPDPVAWDRRLRLEVKSLFYVASAAGADLRTAPQRQAWFLSARALGGPLGTASHLGESSFPGRGGVGGLVKTLAQEWPNVQCRMLHLDTTAPASELADRVLSALSPGDGEVEIGYRAAARLVLRPVPTPLLADGGQDALSHLGRESVVLVTGGARGITAGIASDLARQCGRLVIVGRTALPLHPELPEFTGVTSPRELKGAIIENLRSAGQPVAPSSVEDAYSRLLADREVRANLQAMQGAGASIDYRQLDVRDGEGLRALVEDIYRSHGRIDGAIHGAGIIEDRLIEEKTSASFDRVLDTKAKSAFVLATALRPASLRFLVFFSSIAGCFGNRGQSDYAAANAVLNSLANWLDVRWPGRVVAMNWGPWGGQGMASGELAGMFAARGITPINPEAGRRAFLDELRLGRKGESEVIVGAGPWMAGHDEPPAGRELVAPSSGGSPRSRP